ncbi:TVP38/TMEM64 family protein [Salinigranum rubrum]|uniref:TVP38/TMEM64 family protein n=1 Tax=Salinigranum rubrum TaxID=755307 RepID=A0A2I8VL76_9EURY|nr:VTT domain-containing protein [Salinigranum rubrum]AUV82668.1 TVP38/TMEM64 family protein [Salinigranum rubrum]
MRRSRFLFGLLVLGVLAAAVLVAPGPALRWLTWLAADPIRFGLALFVVALARPLVAWPTTLLAVGAGYGYGFVGVPYALALIVLTSVPPFLVARRFGRESRAASAGERVVREAGDLRSVVASRLLPAPSDVVSVAAGVSGVSLSTFALGTAIGELPWALVGVLAGSSLDTLTEASLAAVDWRLVAACALASVLLLAGPLYRVAVGREDPVVGVDAE